MRWSLFISIPLLLLAGCHSARNGMWNDVLDAEKRALEDQLYAQRAEIQSLQAQLDSTRRENDALRKELDDNDSVVPRSDAGRSNPSGRKPPRLAPESLEGPDVELNDASLESDDLPVELFGPRQRTDELAASEKPRKPASVQTLLPATTSTPKTSVSDRDAVAALTPDLSAVDNLAGMSEENLQTAPADDPVTYIFLNPMLTGGDDFDNSPGDEGISVVIEPRNKDGKYVPQAGAVSIVLLDPAKQGSAARVARWDFDVAETRAALKKSALGRGIHLSLPWPNRPPENDKLHLFVLYVTADQRKLEADRQVYVNRPSQVTSRWTPAPARVAREPAHHGAAQAEVVREAAAAPGSGSPYQAATSGDAPPSPTAAASQEAHHIAAPPKATPASPATPEPARQVERPTWRPFR